MLLNRAALQAATNRADLADTVAYPDAYLATIFGDVQGEITKYLGYDPTLQVVTSEEGMISYVQAGPYVGRYFLRLNVAPFIPGPAATIFTALLLRYGLATLPDSAVNLTTVTVVHQTAQAFTLAPGAVEALTWQYGLTPGVQAVGYLASYVAGYATGIGDPTVPGGGSYGALPMPAAITQAAVLLARERLMLDDAANQQKTNTMAGAQTSIRTLDQAIAYGRAVGKAPLGPPLGGGTPLAEAAARRLDAWRRPTLPLFL